MRPPCAKVVYSRGRCVLVHAAAPATRGDRGSTRHVPFGFVAQWIERLSPEQKVESSNLFEPTIIPSRQPVGRDFPYAREAARCCVDPCSCIDPRSPRQAWTEAGNRSGLIPRNERHPHAPRTGRARTVRGAPEIPLSGTRDTVRNRPRDGSPNAQ